MSWPVPGAAISESVPPSPWLSARVTKKRYFTLTTRMSDQKISDRIPRMPSVRSPAGRCSRHCCIV